MFNYDEFDFVTNSGETKNLSDYAGKMLLIVNTASKCGFTPQYLGLQDLYEKYKSKGLEIIAFPCNQFGEQEPGTDEEISSFCSTYKITFTIASKIDVNGDNAHPLYKHLKSAYKDGHDIGWNFEKFLIGFDGKVYNFGPAADPKMIDAFILDNLI
jgi:glutathione peroxidase